MRAETKYLWFNTKTRHEYIRITDEVTDLLRNVACVMAWYWYRQCILQPAYM